MKIQSKFIFIVWLSRSSTIVIAYLMWKEQKGYYETYFDVKNKRRYIGPNGGFVLQLKFFDEELKKYNYALEKIDFNNCLIVNELKRSLEINFSYIKKKKLNFYRNILNNIQKTINKEYNEIIESDFEERKTFFSKFDKYY